MLIVTNGDSYYCTSALLCIIYLIVHVGVCPPLQHPMNGQVFIHGNMAVFACSDGATVMGKSVLICSNGNWNFPPPTCKFLNP